MDFSKEIEAEFNLLINYYKEKQDYSENFGLYGGMIGDILCLGLAYLKTKDETLLTSLYDRIEYIISNHQDIIFNEGASFSSGVAGWGWCLQWLADNDLIECDTEVLFEDIDHFLSLYAKAFIENGKLDQLNEALGMSLFFFKRKNNEILEIMVHKLNETKYESHNEISWSWHPWNMPETNIFDFSLAHGITGKLMFLYKCYENNILKEICKTLIIKGVNFLLNNIQDFDKIGCFFPNKISVDKYISGKNEAQRSRLAWCYGDLGIWYVLYIISDLIEECDLKEKAIAALIKTITRKTFEETIVLDAGFCHGSSGIAYIYHKMWILTKMNKFRTASTFWYEQTLQYGKKENKPISYLFFTGDFAERKFRENDSFLEGKCGVAISYLSYLEPELMGWDDCFWLS